MCIIVSAKPSELLQAKINNKLSRVSEKLVVVAAYYCSNTNEHIAVLQLPA